MAAHVLSDIARYQRPVVKTDRFVAPGYSEPYPVRPTLYRPSHNSFNKWIKKWLVFMSHYQTMVLMIRNIHKWPAVIVNMTSSVSKQQTERHVLYLQSCWFKSRYRCLLCGLTDVGIVSRIRLRPLRPILLQSWLFSKHRIIIRHAQGDCKVNT